MLYGLIGYPLTHTFSPSYFAQKFAQLGIVAQYDVFPISHIELFPDLLKQHPSLKGLNVTIPYKELILPYLDEVDAVAQQIGAVNCVHLQSGRTIGYNTDVIGFEQSLTPLLQPHMKQALILGTGGASKAVAYALQRLDIGYTLVSRKAHTGGITYSDITADLIQDYHLIVNCTPVGMYPNVDACVQLPCEGITNRHLVYDLIYNPSTTQLLQHALQQGASIKNGYEMLVLQAEAAWQLWQA
jgi:shikimate dehydrogenase